MEVHEITITKEQLQSLSHAERVLVIQFGHVCNELTFLHKLLVIVSNQMSDGIEATVASAQGMMVARIFIGKVCETWKMIERDFFASKLSKELELQLPGEAKQSLDNLKKYFGKKNIIVQIRNNYSFHFSGHIDEILNVFESGRKFRLILGKDYANTLHHFSEEIITYSLLKDTNETEAQAAMNKVIGELVRVSGDMIKVLGHVLALVFSLRFGKSWDNFEHKKLNVDSDFTLYEFKIPFFFKKPN